MAKLDDSNRAIQGLWIGPRLSQMEELSIRSFLAHGHEYHLYTYGPVKNVPEGAFVRDASEIIPAAGIFKYRDYDSYSGFSNYFRYKLLLEKGGWWVDSDLICLRPFDFSDEYVFSSEAVPDGDSTRDVPNVGAIKAASGSPVMRWAWEVCQSKDPRILEWGEIGPLLFAEAIRELKLDRHIRKARVFCPVPWSSWREIITPDHACGIAEDTYAVHLWNELWRRSGFEKDDRYDESCLYERLKAKYLERPSPRMFLAAADSCEPRQNRSLTERVEATQCASPKLPTVSALVVTRDSERRLARCLESIRATGFADEVVVCVDAATTDGTFQVAQQFTPHVHIVLSDGYFESALEKSAAFCACDFVLRIDDDESLDGEWDKASFQLLAAFNDFKQFWMPRRWLVPPGDVFIDSNPWFPDLQPRLFVNEPDRIAWPKNVHEPMSIVGRSVALYDRWINHHAFVDRPRGERRRRSEEYARLNPQLDFSHYYSYEDLDFSTRPCSTTGVEAARPNDVIRRSVFEYPLGSVIRFGTEGTAVDYVGRGWGLPESWGRWTVEEQAEIRLPLADVLGGGATLSVEVMPFLTGLHPTLQVSVLYRETVIGDWSFNEPGPVELTLRIGPDLISWDSSPCLQFRVSEPRAPSETGQSTDTRLLGLGFKSLRLIRSEDSSVLVTSSATGIPDAHFTSRRRPFQRRLNFAETFISKSLRLGRQVLPNVDLDVFWDDMWVFRVGDTCFPRPEVTEPDVWLWHELAASTARFLYEAQDHWYFVYRPKVGDVIVDLGAGRGEDTYAFSRAVGPSGRVVAVEPHPTSFTVLKKFCLLNDLTNVTVLNAACWDKPGRLQIETTSNWASNYTREGDASATSFTVDGLPFDSIWQNCGVGRIDLLKMNIEGAERLALNGSSRALEQTMNICVAAHDHRAERGEAEWFRTGDFVRRFLRASGFHLTPRDDSRAWARDHVHGVRPESTGSC